MSPRSRTLGSLALGSLTLGSLALGGCLRPPSMWHRAQACVEACYLGDATGRAIHLLGPLAGKVIRISPPLVMPLDEARDYLDAMFHIFASVERRLATALIDES